MDCFSVDPHPLQGAGAAAAPVWTGAAGSGFLEVIDMPGSQPQGDEEHIARVVRRAAGIPSATKPARRKREETMDTSPTEVYEEQVSAARADFSRLPAVALLTDPARPVPLSVQ